tara:strand:- start:10968 stop:11231 length:264 start_codon:yes stop_codon:yes gene_type:complete
MVKEFKYFIFFLVISFFIFFSLNHYVSDNNKKKTFRQLSLIDSSLKKYEDSIPLMINDTENIVKYLNNNENKNIKKYSFWDLLKNEN